MLDALNGEGNRVADAKAHSQVFCSNDSHMSFFSVEMKVNGMRLEVCEVGKALCCKAFAQRQA
jgi:hypothetical protein